MEGGPFWSVSVAVTTTMAGGTDNAGKSPGRRGLLRATATAARSHVAREARVLGA